MPVIFISGRSLCISLPLCVTHLIFSHPACPSSSVSPWRFDSVTAAKRRLQSCGGGCQQEWDVCLGTADCSVCGCVSVLVWIWCLRVDTLGVLLCWILSMFRWILCVTFVHFCTSTLDLFLALYPFSQTKGWGLLSSLFPGYTLAVI